jgi:NAD(P)-dependent dehydrogenase (short-subunit alcohol dehydrogenase family)
MNVAMVTGASRGLGLALARGLADAGWALAVDGRGAPALREAERELAEATEVVAVPGDVCDPAHRAELLAAARELGPLRLVVNNAGVLGPSPRPALADYPSAELRVVLESNVVAPLALTAEALPDLRREHGAVLNITSDAAVEAYPGWGGYGAAKAALEQASHVLAAEEPRVRVWWFDPGDLRTQMHAAAFPGEDISDRPLPESVVPAVLDLIARQPPSGRYRAADLRAAVGS